jgi:hypothetical protein
MNCANYTGGSPPRRRATLGDTPIGHSGQKHGQHRGRRHDQGAQTAQSSTSGNVGSEECVGRPGYSSLPLRSCVLAQFRPVPLRSAPFCPVRPGSPYVRGSRRSTICPLTLRIAPHSDPPAGAPSPLQTFVKCSGVTAEQTDCARRSNPSLTWMRACVRRSQEIPQKQPKTARNTRKEMPLSLRIRDQELRIRGAWSRKACEFGGGKFWIRKGGFTDSMRLGNRMRITSPFGT